MKIDVQIQGKWLKKEINVPNASCSLSKAHRATYAVKILNTPNNYNVLENNRCILACDLATIAGSGWLNFSILNGMAEMLHKENEHTAALLLNNIILVDDDDLVEYVKSNFKGSIKYVLLFANVGKSESGEVFISRPGNPGCHWTLLYVDLTTNKWCYCDTNCWGVLENLKTTVELFVKAIYQEIDTTPKPFKEFEKHTLEVWDQLTFVVRLA